MRIYLDEEIQYTAENHPWWAESAGHPESKYSDYILYGGPGNTSRRLGREQRPYRKSWSVAMVNLQAPAVRHYFDDLFVWWVDPHGDGRFDRGVDGFRIDHMMDDLDGRGNSPTSSRVSGAAALARSDSQSQDFDHRGAGGLEDLRDDLLRRGDVDIVYAFRYARHCLARPRRHRESD